MRTHLIRFSAASAFAGLFAQLAIAGAPVLEKSEFERADIPALSRAVQFTPTDWEGEFTGSIVLYMSAEGRGERTASVTLHGTSRTTFIADTVISETSLDRLSMAASDGYREDLGEPSPLAFAKIAATLDGKVISTEIHSSDALNSFDDNMHSKENVSISRNEWAQYIKSQYGFLKSGLSPGKEMGSWLQNAAIDEMLQPCGFSEKIPPLRAVGEYKGAIIGRAVWHPKPTPKCRAELDVTYVVDAVDGRPMRQIFRGKLDLNDSDGQNLHFGLVGLYVPKFLPKATIGSRSAAEKVGPSFERCRNAPKEIGQVAYPEASLDAREEGTAELRVKVGKQGGVEEVSIVKSSGFSRLDEWATAGAHAWKFDSAACAGLSLSVPVEFKAPPQE